MMMKNSQTSSTAHGGGSVVRKNVTTSTAAATATEKQPTKTTLVTIAATVVKRKSTGDERICLYKTKTYLAVRNETNGFYLCQLLTAIYDNTKRSKIQWLEETTKPNQYKNSL